MDHIQYLTECEDGDLAGYTGPGWYFWDETCTHCLGPFDTKDEAKAVSNRYWLTLANIGEKNMSKFNA